MNDIDQTKIQLIKKYGPLKVALYWPEFENKDSHFFSRKNKSIPKLPVGIDDLKDLPDQYKETRWVGFKKAYSENKDFKIWICMAMSFPFLMLRDIDEVWEEMIECKPK